MNKPPLHRVQLDNTDPGHRFQRSGRIILAAALVAGCALDALFAPSGTLVVASSPRR